MNKVNFIKRNVSSSIVFDKDTLSIAGDEIASKLCMTIEAKVYANTIDERDLVYMCPKPSFTDWLFGRTMKAVFKFKASDLLLNPPKIDVDRVIRIYEINKK